MPPPDDTTPAPTPSADGDRIRLAPGVWLESSAATFSFAASSGPGGQNTNKRATKARLHVAVADIPLGNGARGRLRRLAGSLLNDRDEIVIASDRERSQRANREACLERLRELVMRALRPPKVRRKTKPPASVNRKRLEEKKRRGETKKRRGRVDP